MARSPGKTAARSEPPPIQPFGLVTWIRANLMSSWSNAILTILALWFSVRVFIAFFSWAVLDAAFGTTPESCDGIEGACWSFIADTWELYLVGLFPLEERWRPFLCLVILLLLLLASLVGGLRRRRGLFLGLWSVAAFTVFMLLRGGHWIGLKPITTDQWGGLTLTLVLSIVGIVFAFPIGVLVAIGRRSREMPAVRMLCVGYVELFRGVPLVSILFLSSILVPLFLPGELQADALLRAQVGIIVFQAGYIAEVVRGSLQSIPAGQVDAGQALGLRYGSIMRKIILPQALRNAIPALTNQFVIIIKDSSLVAIIGMFDLLGVTQITLAHEDWLGHPFEAFAFVGAIFWVMCFSLSQVSHNLEARLKTRHQ